MRPEEYAYIVLTAAALIFSCSDQHQEKITARATAQQRVTIGAVSPMPTISGQNSQMTASTTRKVIVRYGGQQFDSSRGARRRAKVQRQQPGVQIELTYKSRFPGTT